jgi:hypothetical protein
MFCTIATTANVYIPNIYGLEQTPIMLVINLKKADVMLQQEIDMDRKLIQNGFQGGTIIFSADIRKK